MQWWAWVVVALAVIALLVVAVIAVSTIWQPGKAEE